MTDPKVDAWLKRQPKKIEAEIRALVDFDNNRMREPEIGEPEFGAADCLRRLAAAGRKLPSTRYFRLAHDLLDKAGPLACDVGIKHFGTENEMRVFLALAGTVLFGEAEAIRRFEKNFDVDTPLDDMVTYLQMELEMLESAFPGE